MKAAVTDVQTLLEQVHAQFESNDLFYGHGTDNAWDDAVQLVLGRLDLADDQASLARRVATDDANTILLLAGRRIAEHVPVPYLTGTAWFCGRPFDIEPGVIIPRSPIGELLQRKMKPWLGDDPRRVLDLCCGSGCIGIAAAFAFPKTQVTCADIDAQAVALTARNIGKHGLTDRVEVVRSDLFSKVDGKYDLILCNPPYVNAEDLASMPAEFRQEPMSALDGGVDGGEDGLDIMVRVLTDATSYLSSDGLMVGEVGNSAPAMVERFPRLTPIWPDLEAGGHGIFVLEAKQLDAIDSNSHTARRS